MPVPFLDARLQDGTLRDEIKAAVATALERGPLGGMSGVLEFESRLATVLESRHAVAAATGGEYTV